MLVIAAAALLAGRDSDDHRSPSRQVASRDAEPADNDTPAEASPARAAADTGAYSHPHGQSGTGRRYVPSRTDATRQAAGMDQRGGATAPEAKVAEAQAPAGRGRPATLTPSATTALTGVASPSRPESPESDTEETGSASQPAAHAGATTDSQDTRKPEPHLNGAASESPQPSPELAAEPAAPGTISPELPSGYGPLSNRLSTDTATAIDLSSGSGGPAGTAESDQLSGTADDDSDSPEAGPASPLQGQTTFFGGQAAAFDTADQITASDGADSSPEAVSDAQAGAERADAGPRRTRTPAGVPDWSRYLPPPHGQSQEASSQPASAPPHPSTPSYDSSTPSYDSSTPSYDSSTPSYDSSTPSYDSSTPSYDLSGGTGRGGELMGSDSFGEPVTGGEFPPAGASAPSGAAADLPGASYPGDFN